MIGNVEVFGFWRLPCLFFPFPVTPAAKLQHDGFQPDVTIVCMDNGNIIIVSVWRFLLYRLATFCLPVIIGKAGSAMPLIIAVDSIS